MSYQTPLSKLADHLHIKREAMNVQELVNSASTAARIRIEQLENKLSSTIAHATSMAQELQEIIEAAEDIDNRTMPASQEVVDSWEALYQEQQLINEVAL